ncbi:hypothetical protein C0993_001503, partial [Termitomyces sp. T159_Od127]
PLSFPNSVSIPGTRSVPMPVVSLISGTRLLTDACSSHPLVLLGLAPTPGTRPPPSPALAPLTSATGTPPHTASTPLRSPTPCTPPSALRLCTR